MASVRLMADSRIRVFDRYRGSEFTEAVYGERWLRLAYESAAGRALLPLIAKPFLSRYFGWRMRRPASARLIEPFIRDYNIRMADFLTPPGGFRCFNDFFCRELAPAARPVSDDPGTVVFPADARHLAVPVIGEESAVFVKGQRWDLPALLGHDLELARRFSGGSLVLSRLCPIDYHHFHFPLGGVAHSTRLIPGPLFSVNPIALRRSLAYIWQNKRTITRIEHPNCGEYLFLEIGATNVGSIVQEPRSPQQQVATGQRKGCFAFGGSSVISIFPSGAIRLAGDLLCQSKRAVELYARVGDVMGRLL